MANPLFTCDDLERLTATVAGAWTSAADRDWSVRAGTLDWSCTQTAEHAVDTVVAPALFLASRRQDSYPDGEWKLGTNGSPAALVEALRTNTRLLVGVVATADPSVRAILWRRPVPHVAPPSDFPPRAGLELALHAHDVCTGLGVDFRPPDDVAGHLRAHTAGWPFWTMVDGWSPLTADGDAWADLLRASGRS